MGLCNQDEDSGAICRLPFAYGWATHIGAVLVAPRRTLFRPTLTRQSKKLHDTLLSLTWGLSSPHFRAVLFAMIQNTLLVLVTTLPCCGLLLRALAEERVATTARCALLLVGALLAVELLAAGQLVPCSSLAVLT